MTVPYRVALLGFSLFERNTLASYFRLAADRDPCYEQTRLISDADLVLADAEHDPSVQLVLATERLAETVFVGTGAPEGAGTSVARPVDPEGVLHRLDTLVAARRNAMQNGWAAEDIPELPIGDALVLRELHLPGLADTGPEEVFSAFMPDGEVDLLLDGLSDAPAAPAANGSAGPNPRVATPAAIAPSAAPAYALLVDDSDVAQRFLRRRLESFGIAVACASDSTEALALLGQRSFDFVFLDVELGDASELDGYALCQRIKRAPGSRVALTSVVMVTAHSGELDRARSALAGCDGFLGKPLEDAQLERLLARHGVRARADPGGPPPN